MKALVLLSLVLFSSSAFAANKAYQLDLKLFVNGEHVISPQIIVRDGERGDIMVGSPAEKKFIEVVATEGSMGKTKGILMNFKVGRVLADGSREILAKPTVVSIEGEGASITVGEQGKDEVSLELIATRTSI